MLVYLPQVTTGSNCKVVDPLYNFEFDFSTLRRSSDNYNVTGGGYQFLLNVCGPLVNGPGPCGEGSVSACQTGASLQTPIKIGTALFVSVYLAVVCADRPIFFSCRASQLYLSDQHNGNP